MSADFVQAQLKRSRALMAPERTGVTLTEAAPARDPASLGALGGAGFEAKDPDVRIDVYIFENSDQHYEIAERLIKELAPNGGQYALPSTNGPALFIGWTRTEGAAGAAAEDRLDRIASAFAGDEE